MAALDFTSPVAFRVPPPFEAEPAQDQVETIWTGSIIQMLNGDWLQFAGMDWSQTVLDSLVLYSKDGDASDPKARLKVQALLDVGARERICKKIILGCLGGTFKDKEGTLVKVKSLERTNGKLTHVKYAMVDDDGTELFDEAPVTMFKFTSKFGAPLGEPAESGLDDFDFAPYPKLLDILRTSKLLGESATLMSRSDAASFLTGMRAREDVQNAELGKVASEAEAAAAADKASPALSRLKRAATGSLAEQTPSKKGRVARVLALGLGSRDEMAPPAPPDQPQSSQQDEAALAAARPSKRKRSAPAGNHARKKSAGGGSSGADSDSSDSGSSNDESEEVTQPAEAQAERAGSKKRKGHALRQPQAPQASAEAHSQIFDAPPGDTPMLIKFTPRDIGQYKTASIIFDHARIQQASGAEPIGEAEPPPGQRARLVLRYERALARLQTYMGSAWAAVESQIQTPPRDVSALYSVAEAILDAVTQIQMGTLQQHASSDRPHTAGAEAPASELGGKSLPKPAEGISADKRPWAVLPGTAERLHAAGAQVQAAAAKGKPEAITSLIGEAPANLRDELRAALMSNGAVDNFGETAPERRALPPAIADMIRVTMGAIAHAIELVPKADKTGRCVLDFQTVHELARKVAEGRGTWAEFTTAARKMRGGQAAADVGTGISDVWSLMKPAYEALFKVLAVTDEGLEAMSARISASSAQSRLPPDELSRWAAGVISAYTSQVHKFRQSPLGSATPSIQAAMAEREDAYTFDSYRQALSKSAGRQTHKTADTGDRGDKGKGKGGDKGKGGGKATNGGRGGKTDQTPVTCWTEKKHALSDAKFYELKRAAITKYPNACALWLIAKCSHVKCNREHKRPDDFTDFIDGQGLNLDGTEKCEFPQRAHAPAMRTSSMPSAQHDPPISSGDMGPARPPELAHSGATSAPNLGEALSTISAPNLGEALSSATSAATADAYLPERNGTSASDQPSEEQLAQPNSNSAHSAPPSLRCTGLTALGVPGKESPPPAPTLSPATGELGEDLTSQGLTGPDEASQASAACHRCAPPPYHLNLRLPAHSGSTHARRETRRAAPYACKHARAPRGPSPPLHTGGGAGGRQHRRQRRSHGHSPS